MSGVAALRTVVIEAIHATHCGCVIPTVTDGIAADAVLAALDPSGNAVASDFALKHYETVYQLTLIERDDAREQVARARARCDEWDKPWHSARSRVVAKSILRALDGMDGGNRG